MWNYSSSTRCSLLQQCKQQQAVLLAPVTFKLLSNSGCFLQITPLRDVLCCVLDIPAIETTAALQCVSSHPFELDWFLSLKCTKIPVLKPKKKICWIHRPLLDILHLCWCKCRLMGIKKLQQAYRTESTDTIILLVKIFLLLSLAFQFEARAICICFVVWIYYISLKGTWRAYFVFIKYIIVLKLTYMG